MYVLKVPKPVLNLDISLFTLNSLVEVYLHQRISEVYEYTSITLATATVDLPVHSWCSNLDLHIVAVCSVPKSVQSVWYVAV